MMLATSVFGYVIDLADDNTEGIVGMTPFDEAKITYECPGKTPGSIGFKNLEQDYQSQIDIVAEMLYMPETCINKQAHLEPCVPHDPMSKSYFGCQYTIHNTGLQILTEGSKPWQEWISVDQLRVGKVTKVNCSVPTEWQLTRMAEYSFETGKVEASVQVVHFVNGTMTGTNNILNHYGDGPAVFTMTGLMTPPQLPPPPAPPPSPMLPDFAEGTPGWLYHNNQQAIRTLLGGTMPVTMTLCYSTSAGHTKNSQTWHSKCDNKGYTLGMYRVTYSTNTKILGSYTRYTWAGGGYTGDASSAITSASDSLFQLSPNVFKTFAGSGPHSNYGNSMYRSNGYGPTFGAGHDWYIASNLNTGYSNFGHTYKCRTGNYGQNACRNDWTTTYSSWAIAEMEMWGENP